MHRVKCSPIATVPVAISVLMNMRRYVMRQLINMGYHIKDSNFSQVYVYLPEVPDQKVITLLGLLDDECINRSLIWIREITAGMDNLLARYEIDADLIAEEHKALANGIYNHMIDRGISPGCYTEALENLHTYFDTAIPIIPLLYNMSLTNEVVFDDHMYAYQLPEVSGNADEFLESMQTLMTNTEDCLMTVHAQLSFVEQEYSSVSMYI